MTVTSIPGMTPEAPRIPVLDLSANDHDIVTSDGRYFVEADVFVNQIHDIIHDTLIPQAVAHGMDEEEFSGSAHVVVNFLTATLDQASMFIGMQLLLESLGTIEDPNDA